MKFVKYYRSLNKAEREAFALRAKTTVGYIENHLIFARKVPRSKLMARLVMASDGHLVMDDLLAHFYSSGCAA